MDFENRFNREEAPDSIEKDDVVALMEYEYGVTRPSFDRPVLRTRGVGYSPKKACSGFLLNDPEKRVGAMAHVHMEDNPRFYQCFRDVLNDAHRLGGENFDFVHIGEHTPENVEEGLEKAVEHLAKDDSLRSIRQLDAINGVLDTRNNSIYEESDHLLNYDAPHPSQRPYGSSRYDEDTGLPVWNRAYPVEIE